jgi:hypothetical protein
MINSCSAGGLHNLEENESTSLSTARAKVLKTITNKILINATENNLVFIKLSSLN